MLITHKLDEVMRLSDRITVMRRGEYGGADGDARHVVARSRAPWWVASSTLGGGATASARPAR